MGNEGKNNASQHTLVVMSNKDTYYLDAVTTIRLKQGIDNNEVKGVGLLTFTDARSHKQVTINLSQLSSIVESQV